MVQINFAQKQVNAKIVYYGPGMSGKTTNLEVIHQRAPEANKGDLTSISTDGDRTLFFDFMPLDLGTVAGMRTSFQIYTVPGQVYYNSTRKLVLQGVDGVVFVADSSPSMVEENLESLRNLEENLADYGKSLATLPHIIQFNKRDLPDALPVDEMNGVLNRYNVPTFEAIANTGQGVFPTLKALAAAVLESIHSGSNAPPSSARPAPASQAAASASAAKPSAPPAAPAPRRPVVNPPKAAPPVAASAAPAPAPATRGREVAATPAAQTGLRLASETPQIGGQQKAHTTFHPAHQPQARVQNAVSLQTGRAAERLPPEGPEVVDEGQIRRHERGSPALLRVPGAAEALGRVDAPLQGAVERLEQGRYRARIRVEDHERLASLVSGLAQEVPEGPAERQPLTAAHAGHPLEHPRARRPGHRRRPVGAVVGHDDDLVERARIVELLERPQQRGEGLGLVVSWHHHREAVVGGTAGRRRPPRDERGQGQSGQIDREHQRPQEEGQLEERQGLLEAEHHE